MRHRIVATLVDEAMQDLTEHGQHLVDAAANRHGFSADAVHTLLLALAAGGGRQAQFSHWELGGMGQWSQGGMMMIGDMFNNGLKYRVDALCNDLSAALQNGSPFAPPPMAPRGAQSTSFFTPGSFGNRWPAELGTPSSSGSQNDLHYAVFPETRRLALDQGGHISVYDTADHAITGFAQAQGDGQSITLTSQYGLVRLSDLRQVSGAGAHASATQDAPAMRDAPVAYAPAAHDAPPLAEPAPSPPFRAAAPMASAVPALGDDEIFSRIERLADLYKKDILTAEEFSAKKAELLARL